MNQQTSVRTTGANKVTAERQHEHALLPVGMSPVQAGNATDASGDYTLRRLKTALDITYFASVTLDLQGMSAAQAGFGMLTGRMDRCHKTCYAKSAKVNRHTKHCRSLLMMATFPT